MIKFKNIGLAAAVISSLIFGSIQQSKADDADTVIFFGKTSEGDRLAYAKSAVFSGRGGAVFTYYVVDGKTEEVRSNRAFTPYCVSGKLLQTLPATETRYLDLPTLGWYVIDYSSSGYLYHPIVATSTASVNLLKVVCGISENVSQ